MWNAKRSVVLSVVCTKIVIGAVFAVMAALPVFLLVQSDVFFQPLVELFLPAGLPGIILLPVFYLTCIPVLMAFFNLCGLLKAVKGREVFVPANVRRLRTISWACFLVAFLFLATDLIWAFCSEDGQASFRIDPLLLFFAMAVLSAFMGLILRVVKNVFEAAVQLKTENDLTI